MRILRNSGAVCSLLFALITMQIYAAEPQKAALTYEQEEERAGFIALVRKARQGDTDSQWQVGRVYARIGEPARAMLMLQSAAAAGHPLAATLLGSLHEEEGSAGENRQAAERWYRRAAESGHPEAMAALGRLMLQEQGSAARETAGRWLREAARLGDRDGQYWLGWLQVQPGAAQDDAHAFQLFLSAAQQGHVGAQVAVATHFLSGRGVARDKKAAAEWLERAAAKSDPVAHYLLARLRDDGEETGRATALGSYRIAAEAGHRESQFVLGTRLAKSRVEAEWKEAVGWFAKARDAGHIAAANRLGETYRDGIGVLREFGKAKAFFQEAAEQGDANAMYNLAEMLNHGQGGLVDTEKALKWYASAAELGHQGAVSVVETLLNSSVKTSSLGLKGFWQ